MRNFSLKYLFLIVALGVAAVPSIAAAGESRFHDHGVTAASDYSHPAWDHAMGKVSMFASISAYLIPEAMADEAPLPPAITVPDGDPLASLMGLVLNWKTMTPLGLGVALVFLVVQIIKKFAPDFKYKRLTVTALSIVYAVLLSLSQGLPPVQALIAAVITGGGAVALYEAWKGISGQSSNA